MEARFLITDIVRAIRDKKILSTSTDYIVRDFIHPSDFFQLVSQLINFGTGNFSVDCYSKAPVEKSVLLASIKEEFGLQYETKATTVGINATGGKPHYYSLYRRAADVGYQPTHTSLDGILKELRLVLNKN
jgi:hypothetical protein